MRSHEYIHARNLKAAGSYVKEGNKFWERLETIEKEVGVTESRKQIRDTTSLLHNLMDKLSRALHHNKAHAIFMRHDILNVHL
jgi:hypothetical protein